MRDFTLMVKNKMRRARSKVGYLPVDPVDEGRPLEHGQSAPQNPATETLHQRMHVLSHRLLKRQQESASALNVNKALALNGEPQHVQLEEGAGRPLRIHKSQTEGAAPRLEPSTDVKSPFQLLKQVEQMHKEEMDQLLQKLQYENR